MPRNQADEYNKALTTNRAKTKTTKSIEELTDAARGVRIRGQWFQINFVYMGLRFWETLSGLPVTKSNLTKVINDRGEILQQISRGEFDYKSRFPNSIKNIERVEALKPSKARVTLGEALIKQMKVRKIKLRAKQYGLELSRCNKYILPYFGDKMLDSITVSDITEWREMELKLNLELSHKTINDIFTPIRQVFKTALADRVIEFNPLAHVPNLIREAPPGPDPFETTEIVKIMTYPTSFYNEQMGIAFAIWTGLRISEWKALAWLDIDFDKRLAYVRRAVVEGVYGPTKNAKSTRTVELTDQALSILARMRERLPQQAEPPKFKVQVLQSNNLNYRLEHLDFVFLSSTDNQPLLNYPSFRSGPSKTIFSELEIKNRGPNQARHTFACQMLTKGAPERWLINQMGHSSIITFEKHYGKWMNIEQPDMAGNISKLF